MEITSPAAVIGGDERQRWMAELLRQRGVEVLPFAVPGLADAGTLQEVVRRAGVLFCPVPFCRGEQIHAPAHKQPLPLRELLICLREGQRLFGGCLPPQLEGRPGMTDYLSIQAVAIANAVATAEGAVAEAILASPENLHGSQSLVVGFGRCGKVLAQKLSGLSAQVTVAARSDEQRALAQALGWQAIQTEQLPAQAEKFLFVFNTVPAPLLDQCVLQNCANDVTIIDLASPPGGTDFAFARQRGLNARHCLGLPGKAAPKASARFLLDAALSILHPTTGKK